MGYDMKIWAISDVHLPGGTGKTMDRFGNVWIDHTRKIYSNWTTRVSTSDIVLVGGDLTWTSHTEKGLEDVKWISKLPGKAKILIKGNHDVWWKDTDMVNEQSPKDVFALDGTAVKIDGKVICGAKGWVSPRDPDFDGLDRKYYDKELLNLEAALEDAMRLDPQEGIHVVTHFPVFTSVGIKTAFFDLLKRYPVVTSTYGHFHLKEEWDKLPKGTVDGIRCQLTSADFLENAPALIWED